MSAGVGRLLHTQFFRFCRSDTWRSPEHKLTRTDVIQNLDKWQWHAGNVPMQEVRATGLCEWLGLVNACRWN